jgi:hypothetical protein
MSDNKPNLDLIQMVQRARMAHDATAVPSAVGGNYWIEAKPHDAASVAAPTPHAGYWQIEVSAAQVDELWQIVRAATERGELGYKSRVATAGRANSTARMIHVKTYDRRDADDVARVRQRLTDLGIAAACVRAYA